MSKIINNLNEFLACRGFANDDARNWSRCFYKYTDCGPWVVFYTDDDGEIYYEDFLRDMQMACDVPL